LSNLNSAIGANGKQTFNFNWKRVRLSHEGIWSDFVKLYRQQVPSLSQFPYSLTPQQIKRYFVVLSIPHFTIYPLVFTQTLMVLFP